MTHFMLQRTLIVMAVVMITALNVGCKDDEDLPRAWDQYFPAQKGDWQVFRHMTLGATGDTLIVRIDSVHYHNTTMINGHSALIGVVYDLDSEVPRDTLYYAVWDNGAYRYYNPASFLELSSFSFLPQWTRFGNFGDDADKWTTLDTSLTDIPFTIGGSSHTGSGTVMQTYERGGLSVVVLDNDARTPVQTRMFIATTTYDFKLLMNGDTVPVRFSNVERLHFSKGRGLVKHERDGYAVNVDSVSIPVNGFDRLMRANHAN